MKKLPFLLLFLIIILRLDAQIVINEASNRNFTQINDENGEQHDWFELYNSGTTDINLENWGISDNKQALFKWTFPKINFKAGENLVVFASGLNIKKSSYVNHWESAILPTNLFEYIVPDASTSKEWKTIGFNASSWKVGQAGFGFGDGDDSTIVSSTSYAVYVRKKFIITDTASIADAILHVDYDDGFVAYLNGKEIARKGIDGTPLWNHIANISHEALIYQGGVPEKFQLDMNLIRSIWQQGENLFAIEVHNNSMTSSDMSLIPFLSFGIVNVSSYFQPSPSWFAAATGNTLHTNFKLQSKGETLYLSSPDNRIVDTLSIPKIFLNSSVGRTTDGAETTGIFLSATPGKSNNSSKVFTNGYEPMPRFNYDPGFYSQTINVVITDTSNTAELRYTTDGSDPNENSSLYNGSPIVISSTKTLRARCFSTTDKMPGKIKTATYFITKTHAIPVVSVSTNKENLYGTSGIFDNIDATWNKPCYVEYFDMNKELKFSQEAGIQVDGGAGGSRSNPQHSFRIEPGNGTFGEGNVEYNLIPDRQNRKNYSSFYLRNGSNQYSTLQYKDGLQVTAIAKNTYTYYSAHTAVVAYINGSYSGVYELREKLNADFLKYNYLMDNDSLDLLTLSYYKGQVLEALEGSTDQFWKDYNYFKTLTPTSKTYLDQVSKFLDLDNYTDYIVAESWICNTDWPNNNIRVFRNKSTGYKWQYAVQDVEWAMDPNSWSTSTTDHIAVMLSNDLSYPAVGFWINLMKNKDYKVSFINRFADLMNTNYLFSVIGPMEQEKYDFQYPEMTASFAKWGNSNISDYTKNHNIFRQQLACRSENVRNHIVKNFNLSNQVEVTLDVQPSGAGQIKISTITPVNYPWNGIYFSEIPVKITAIANPGYKFVGWNDNPLITNITETEFVATMSNVKESFIANFEASDEAFKGVTISEIHYKNGLYESTSDWVEILNAGDSEVNLKGWYMTDDDSLNKFEFNDKDIIQVKSRIIVARNAIDFGFKYPEVSNVTGPFNFKLGSPIDAVKLYDGTKTLIAAVNYSDLYPWPLNGDDNGRTLELRNPAGDLSNPNNWFAGCKGGSPGTAFQPCPIEVGEEKIELNKTTLSAYPVPAIDFINISITLPNAANNCTLNIYDMFGGVVKTINIGNIQSGIYMSQIDLSSTPSGLLFIQFQSDNIKEYTKIMRVK